MSVFGLAALIPMIPQLLVLPMPIQTAIILAGTTL